MCMARDALVAAVPPPVLVPSALDNSHKKNLVLLQAAMKYAPNRWMFQRYQAVALVLKGYLYAAVSEIIGRSLATVSHYVQANRHGGLAALKRRHSPGRPQRLTAEQEQTVAAVNTFLATISQDPMTISSIASAFGSKGAYPSCFHVRRTFFHGWAGIALSAWRRLNRLTLCIPLRPCSWESPWPSVQMNPNASALNWQHCHYLPVVFVILYDRIYRRLPFNRMLSGMTNTPNQKVPRLWAWAHVTHGTFSHEMTRERASAAYPSNVHWARPRCDGAKKRLRVRRKALEIDADRLSQQDRHRS